MTAPRAGQHTHGHHIRSCGSGMTHAPDTHLHSSPLCTYMPRWWPLLQSHSVRACTKSSQIPMRIDSVSALGLRLALIPHDALAHSRLTFATSEMQRITVAEDIDAQFACY